MKLNCVIVEDDDVSSALLEALAERSELLNIVQSFNSPQKALQWFSTNSVDLLFLDIEMPGISGLELLHALAVKPEVIIITASPDYAAQAFEYSVIDYLIKPIEDYGRFLNAVNKAVIKCAQRNVISVVESGTLFIRVDSLLVGISINDIIWIEAFGDYVKIQTLEKVHTTYSTLKNIMEKLSDKKFVRVHRSHVVNITKISNLDPSNLEINKKSIPIGASYKEQLLNMINIL